MQILTKMIDNNLIIWVFDEFVGRAVSFHGKFPIPIDTGNHGGPMIIVHVAMNDKITTQ
jgi:hypothetical protein